MTIKGIYFIITPIVLFLIYLGYIELFDYIQNLPENMKKEQIGIIIMLSIASYIILMCAEAVFKEDSKDFILIKPIVWFTQLLGIFGLIIYKIGAIIINNINKVIDFINKHLTVKI